MTDPRLVSRRVIIRGASVAVPTILTLNSGVAAAFARSSSLIGAKTSGAPAGDKFCLDVSAYDPVAGSTSGTIKYDLGRNPDFDVVRIPESLNYRNKALPGNPAASAEQVCVTSGDYQYRSGTSGAWTDLNDTRKPSVLVSATALNSFAGKYAEIDIRSL